MRLLAWTKNISGRQRNEGSWNYWWTQLWPLDPGLLGQFQLSIRDQQEITQLKRKEHSLLPCCLTSSLQGAARSTLWQMSALFVLLYSPGTSGRHDIIPQVCHPIGMVGRTSFLSLSFGQNSPNHVYKFSLEFYTPEHNFSFLISLALLWPVAEIYQVPPFLIHSWFPSNPSTSSLLSLLGSWQDWPNQFGASERLLKQGCQLILGWPWSPPACINSCNLLETLARPREREDFPTSGARLSSCGHIEDKYQDLGALTQQLIQVGFIPG